MEYTKPNSALEAGFAGRAAGQFGVGFQFTPEFALETNYQYFGSTQESTKIPFTNIPAQLHSNAYVFNLLGVMRTRITSDRFHFLIKLGSGYANISRELKIGEGALSSSVSGTSKGFSITYTTGIEYAFTSRLSLTGEYVGTTLFASGDDDNSLEMVAGNHEQLNSMMVSGVWRY